MKTPDPRDLAVPWHSRLNAVNLTFVLFLGALLLSLPALEGSGRQVDYLGNLSRFASQFFPPDLSVLPRTLEGLWETFQIACLATGLAIALSLILAIGAAQNLAPRPIVILVRMTLNVIRTIPGLLWALLAVVVVGPNSLAGVVALTFYSIGYLGKFYSEAFEAADLRPLSALRQLGASRFQAFQYGLWPNVKPIVWSHSLWMLEYNVRSASIIGYVGAGGIGLHLKLYAESPQGWSKFATVLLCILLVVTALDFLGEHVRRLIKQRLEGQTAD